MADNRELPIYNLKAVVQETGLKPDTLRAWERRYGLPEPQRTQSGHRLYTGRDVETLKWLIARQEEGLTISRAVVLWHELSRDGNDPLDRAPSSHQSRRAVSDAPAPAPGQPNMLTELKERWVSSCLDFDERGAEQTLNDAFALFPVEAVCTGLMQQALADIGEGWYQGRVTVQQEHFASSLAMRRLEALLVSTPAPTRSARILVGCPPHESHTFVPLMLSLLLRRRGWDVVYLGADVPLRSLELTVDAAAPDLVILTAQQLHTAASLLDMARLLLHKRVPLAYGGMTFNESPDLRRMIPGHFLGPRIGSAVQAVEEIMIAPRVRLSSRSVPQEYMDALHHFREHRAEIEVDIWRSLEESGVSQANLTDANMGLARGIEAALALGGMHHLSAGIDWIEGLLVNHYQLPPSVLDDYLHSYARAAARHLGSDGRVVVDWLAGLAGAGFGLAEPYVSYASQELSRVSAITSHRRS